MLQSIDTGIWIAEAPFKLLGIDFGNRMTCIQLHDKSLFLHSPLKFDQALFEELSKLGEIKYLVAPSLMHNLFIMDWKQHCPAAEVLAPAMAKKVQADIVLEQSIVALNQMFPGEISIIPVRGMPMLQEYVFIHLPSKTLILTDLVFNFSDDVSGWTKFFMKAYGVYNKLGPSITIRAMVRDKNAFRASIRQVASKPFDRIIMSHGGVVEEDGNARFESAFRNYIAVQETIN